MTVTFNSNEDKPGRAVKSVEVWTNDPENKMVTLVLTGEVTSSPGWEKKAQEKGDGK